MARALALLEAPPPPAMPDTGGFGDCGDFGEPVEYLKEAAPAPAIQPRRGGAYRLPSSIQPRRGGAYRLPSSAQPNLPPLPGDWCSCCGRFEKAGGRWWIEAVAPRGWRCRTCYPPSHLRAGQWIEVTT